jgi:cell division GTPase FtsZ
MDLHTFLDTIGIKLSIKIISNMIQIVTKEWEITKNYIFEVAMREGLINLDWYDFERRAQESRPAVEVKVDEPLDISSMIEKAGEEVKKNINGTLSSLMLLISYKKDKELMMEEMNGLNDILPKLAEDNVDICWGIQQNEQTENDRCITIYAFER